MKKPLIIFGVGKIAEVAFYYQNYTDVEHRCIAFTCDEEYMPAEGQFCGLPVIAFTKGALEHFWQENNNDGPVRMLLPIGYKNVNTVRMEKYRQAKEWGFETPSYIHPSVTIWPNTKVGENCFILENNVVQPGATIGDNVVIWSHCHIGHHSSLGNHSWVTSGAVICGSAVIGESAFIGAGAIIRDNIEIADGTVVGMGGVITKSTKPGQIFLSGTNNLFKRAAVQL